MIDQIPFPDDTEEPYSATTLESVQKAARARGCVVRFAGPNELFLDIDSAEAAALFLVTLPILRRMGERGFYVRTPSPSGLPGKEHIVVTLERPVKDEFERVALQALLGSDPKREMLALESFRSGCDPKVVSVFFEKAESTNG